MTTPVDVTFKVVCQVLAPRDNRQVLEAMFSTTIDWPAIVTYTSEHLVLPAFYQALKDKQLAPLLPHDARDYFDTVQELATSRNREFVTELEHICQALNAEEIVPVVLKGGAALLDTIYSNPLTRIMSDLDLLIPAARHTDSIRILKSLGYAEHRIKERDDYHDYHPLLKQDSPVVVELHRMVTDADYTHILPVADVLHDSLELHIGNSRVRLPSPTHRVIHNIVHAQLQDYGHDLGKISLRQLYECAMLCQRYHDNIDWPRVEAAFKSRHEQHVMQHYLAMCQAYFELPCHLPLVNAARVDAILQDSVSVGRSRQISIGLLRRVRNVLRQPGRLRRLFNPAWYAFNFRNLRHSWRRR